MVSDSDISQQPGKYHKAADAVYGLPQNTAEKNKGNADIDKDNPTYCIVAQRSKPNTVFRVNRGNKELLSFAEEMKDAQADDVLRQYLKGELKKNGTTALNEDELLCRKASTNRAI